MSFLNKVMANSKNTNKGGVNPFATATNDVDPFAKETGGKNMSNTNDPFIQKAAVPSPTFGAKPVGGVPNKPAFAPKPGGMPTGMPSAGPGAPSFAPKPSPVPNSFAPKAVETVNEDKPKEVAPVKKDTVVDVPEKEDIVKEMQEADKEQEVKKEDKPKASSRRKAAPKKKVEDSKDEESNSEEVEVVERLFKIPTTNLSYADAIKAISKQFVDENWIEFRTGLIKQIDDITIEADMQEVAMKKTISKLNELRDQVNIAFIDTKILFESLTSKETEGMIERIKYANLEGMNETARKKSGVLAVMNHVTPDGEIVNLYEVYDETRARYLFLKGIMDSIKFKADSLITMSSALKLESKI